MSSCHKRACDDTINGITLFLQIKMFVYGSQFLVIVNVLVIV